MFLKISEAANLALHAMVYLAAEDGIDPVRAETIATSLDVSKTHLVKVLQRLNKAGLVHSVRGPGGGYRLVRAGGKIRLLDVYEAIDGRLRVDGCLFDDHVCRRQGCILGDLLGEIGNLAHRKFSETTLEMVVEGGPLNARRPE